MHRNKLLFLFILIFSSCRMPERNEDGSGCAFPDGYERIVVSQDDPYQNWQIRATGKVLMWNGIVTSDSELQDFSRQLAKLPAEAGSAVFQVTESVSCEDRTRVRLALLHSGLCKQGRCWELEGVVKAPIVYSSAPEQ